MSCKFLKESIKPGTSKSITAYNHICFTDRHHYSRLNHNDTVAKYRGTVLGESLDFDKMSELIAQEEMAQEEMAQSSGTDTGNVVVRSVSISEAIESLCGRELLERLREA